LRCTPYNDRLFSKARYRREPCRLVVFCNSARSPLWRLVAKYRYGDFIVADLPSGKDGFLLPGQEGGLALDRCHR
jgi:hypothetical protein